MSWILGAIYCGLIWLVFAKLKLLRLSLPLAILLASVGPSLILVLLFCAQYLHPYTPTAIVMEQVDPIVPLLSQPGRVTEVLVEPNRKVASGDVLFKVDPAPYEYALKRAQAAFEQAKQNIRLAETSVRLAEVSRERSDAELKYATSDRDRQQTLRQSGGASQDELERAITRFKQSEAELTQAEQNVEQSKLAVDVAKAQEAQAASQLDDAKYDLEQTTVYAPAEGYVTNLQLRTGAFVGGGSGAVMSFVRDSPNSDGVVVATFPEKNYLRIQPGQYAEVAMDCYPGAILTGRVETTIDVTGKGQLPASGMLPTTLIDGKPTFFAVRIKLDDATLRLPGGAQGQAAVYTDDLQIAGIPVMFLIRAKSWLNYLF